MLLAASGVATPGGRAAIPPASAADIRTDAGPPAPLLSSTSHIVGAWSRERTVRVNWSWPSSSPSISGVSIAWTRNSATTPDTIAEATGSTTAAVSAPLASAGDWYVHVRGADAAGTWGATAHLGPFRIDRILPRVPTVRILPAVHTARQVPIAWSGRDDLSGIASYDVRRRTPAPSGEATAYHPWLTGRTTSSATFVGAPGGASCFSMRARDVAGNVSAWSADRCTALPWDDAEMSGTWTRASGVTGAYESTTSGGTTASGALQRAGLTGDRVAVVVTRCPSCGAIRVTWNGTLIGGGAIPLRAPTRAPRQLVWLPVPASLARPGTVAVSAAGPGTVELDGLAVTSFVADPTAAQPQMQRVPFVPVRTFWSTGVGVSASALATRFRTTSTTAAPLYVPTGSVQPLADAYGVAPGAAVRPVPLAEIPARLRARPTAIALLPAGDVTPDIRAIPLDGEELFGNRRLSSLAGWRVVAPVTLADSPDASRPAFSPSALWTLAAGGDVMLDRRIYEQTRIKGKGTDFPWDGGTARIASRYCCNSIGNTMVRPERTGNAGALRALLTGADVAMVNLEGPAPDDFVYHRHGLVFTFDPTLLPGLVRAGIDFVSLANNHIGNGGPTGITDTVRHLDELGILHTGAGADLADAREPAWITTRSGTRIAVLGYNEVNGIYPAGATTPGNVPLRASLYEPDIRAARAAGADVIVVWPHWGREYVAAPTAAQRDHARRMIAAGADLILGNHSHWAGAMEVIDGKLVMYSLGNLVFDLMRSEETQESVVPELTFAGSRLVQVRLVPTVIVDYAQPNLMVVPGDGEVVLSRMRAASRPLLAW